MHGIMLARCLMGHVLPQDEQGSGQICGIRSGQLQPCQVRAA